MHMAPEGTDSQAKQQNGNAKKLAANGSASKGQVAHEAALETPGLAQLAICVLGIYASL